MALAALGVTLAVETPIVVLWLRRLGAPPVRTALICVLVNVATQPLLYWTVAHTVTPWAETLAGAEVVVWIVEALAYLALTPALRRTSRPLVTALAVSLVANAASVSIGLLLPF